MLPTGLAIFVVLWATGAPVWVAFTFIGVWLVQWALWNYAKIRAVRKAAQQREMRMTSREAQQLEAEDDGRVLPKLQTLLQEHPDVFQK